MITAVTFSIVIPTVKIPRTLFDLLKSIEKIKNAKPLEVIVIQNPENIRADFAWKNKFPTLKLVFGSCEAGVNRARNLGLKLARGKYVLFLDDDCKISDLKIFEKHESAHLAHPECFAVGGFYKTLSKRRIDQAYDLIQKRWLMINCLSVPGECSTLLGGHFSIKNSSNVPLFDPSIVYGGSETEYFWRLGLQGYKFHLIDCSVVHSPGLNLKVFAKKAFKQGRTHRRLIKTFSPPTPYWVETKVEKNFYQNYYEFWFDPWTFICTNIHKKFRKLSLGRQVLIDFHQQLCLYLENLRLF